MEDSFKLLLEEWKKQINLRLRNFLEIQEPPILYDPIRYVFDGEGKRIRPVLLLLACQATGGEIDQAWDAAVAIELLHNFTLVHDDIMDEDDTRRGRLTLHKKYAPDIALLAGDGIFALAYKSLLRTESRDIKKILEIFTDGIIAVCEGQALDLDFEDRETVTLPEYLEMISKKTAYLLSTSAQIGATIGNGHPLEVAALGEFARNLGCAFQIQDDLLDITADEKILGKTFGSDVRQKKQTYLVVHTLSQSDARVKTQLQRIFDEPNISINQIHEVRQLFEEAGSIRAAQNAVSQFLSHAKNELEKLKESQAKIYLFNLLEYISGRNF